jgi:Cytochrome oxidase complex assembly protein 1
MSATPPPLPGHEPSQPQPPTVPASSRHRKPWVWLISLLGVLLITAFVLLTLHTVQNLMQPNPALDATLLAVQQSPKAIAVLGKPIQYREATTYPPQKGKVVTEVDISIYGPKKSGFLSAEATPHKGAWRVTKLTLTVDGHGPPIDLLATTSDPSP